MVDKILHGIGAKRAIDAIADERENNQLLS